jgi:hypothetical protein
MLSHANTDGDDIQGRDDEQVLAFDCCLDRLLGGNGRFSGRG